MISATFNEFNYLKATAEVIHVSGLDEFPMVFDESGIVIRFPTNDQVVFINVEISKDYLESYTCRTKCCYKIPSLPFYKLIKEMATNTMTLTIKKSELIIDIIVTGGKQIQSKMIVTPCDTTYEVPENERICSISMKQDTFTSFVKTMMNLGQTIEFKVSKENELVVYGEGNTNFNRTIIRQKFDDGSVNTSEKITKIFNPLYLYRFMNFIPVEYISLFFDDHPYSHFVMGNDVYTFNLYIAERRNEETD